MSAKGTPIGELNQYLHGLIERCRLMRWLGCSVHVEIAADIAKDVSEHQGKLSQRAYTATVEDSEADRLISEALAGGLNDSDIPLIAQALKHVRRSAKIDREISESLA